LGRIFRRRFREAGHEVLAFSRHADATHLGLSDLFPLIERGSCDVVLHLAWSTVPATAEQRPGTAEQEDLPLLQRLLACLDTRQGATPQLIFFSTCAVYGEPPSGHVFVETDAPAPKGRYASGKVAAERLLECFRIEHNVTSCVLRVTNPYGFTQADHCMQGVLPAMIKAAIHRQEFVAWGDGSAVKDYLHVDDLCEAVDGVIQTGLTGIFNVASGESRPLSELAAGVERATGSRLTMRHSTSHDWDVQGGRYSHAALNRAIGWSPRVDFAEGVREFAGAVAVEMGR
jgi:UDP-glucose 4-epimerase